MIITICDIAEEDQNTWYLIRHNPHYPNSTGIVQVWWAVKGMSPSGPAFVNHNGGYCLQDKKSIDVLQVREAKSYWDLPQTETSEFQQLINPPSHCRMGWLSPEGAFHPCAYMDHDRYVNIVLGRWVKDLETEGWIRITGFGGELQLLNKREPTDEQLQYLADNDYL